MDSKGNVIQVIGRSSCNGTKKALRFLKERGWAHQFVDLDRRSLSAGKLESVFRCISPEDCIDRNCKEYRRRQLDYQVYDAEEEIAADNRLIATPILRCRGKAVLGFDEDFLKEMH